MSAPSTAVVTGATSGIGAAVVERLLAAGERVVGVGRDPRRCADLAARPGVVVVRGDLTDAATVERVAAEAGDRVSLLVHAAGSGAASALDATPDAVLDRVLADDLSAPVHLTRALLPAVRRAGGGTVFVASVAVLGVPGETVYGAAKAGLRGFADALRLETGLRVTTVLPGVVDTPFTTARGGPPRRFPRPVPADRVAAAALDAVARGRVEVAVPRWLTVALRLHGLAPATYVRLARRFG